MKRQKEPITKTKYLAPKFAECHFCAARFHPTDPAQNDHWRVCPKHPARAALERLEADNDTLRQAVRNLEKNQAQLATRLAEAEAY